MPLGIIDMGDFVKSLVSILFIFSFASFAQTAGPAADLEFEKESQEIYQALGLMNEVPKDVFDQGYIAFQSLKGEGKLAKLPLITFVNFSIPSNRERFFVVDLQAKTVVMRAQVAHGKNSGGHSAPATQFSNTDNSLQSSLGFYLTGESYSGKHGLSLRLDGLSNGLNTNARDRAIVIHAASYVASGGRSYGCLALTPDNNTKAIALLKNRTLIYAYTSSQFAKLGSKDSAVVASSDKSYTTPADVSSVEPEFATFESMPALSKATPSIGSAGVVGAVGVAGVAGAVLLKGSDKYEKCQNLSNTSWSDTVKGIESGKSPSTFFTGSWAALKNEVQENEVDNEDAVKLSEERLSDINDCVAMAHISTRTDFSKSSINTPETKSSADGKIKCVYNSPESQDYTTCVKSIATYEALGVEEKKIHAEQAQDLTASNAAKAATLTGGDVQAKALSYSQESQKDMSNIALERAEISNEKINQLQAIASKIPTKESLFDECEAKFSKHGIVSRDEYSAFLKMYSSKSVEPKLAASHCANAVSSSVNPIQNEVARGEIKKVLKEFGKEVEDYSSKSAAFLNRESPLLDSASGIGLVAQAGIGGGALTNGVSGFDTEYASNGPSPLIQGANTVGDSSAPTDMKNHYKSASSFNSPVSSLLNFSGNSNTEEMNESENSRLVQAGIYQQGFYQKINFALKNPDFLKSLNLSPEQMKEYLERKKYFDSLKEGSERTPASEGGSKRKKKESDLYFYHSKELDLFEIISKKYREVFHEM